MSELKPCPFCGGEAKIKSDSYNGGFYWAECEHCEASSDVFLSDKPKETAIASWNARPRETELEAEIERLKESQRWIDPNIETPSDRDDPVIQYNDQSREYSEYLAKFTIRDVDGTFVEKVGYCYDTGTFIFVNGGEILDIKVIGYKPLSDA